MKTIPFIIIMVSTLLACQQKKEVIVPTLIKEAFRRLHPNATDVRWIQEPSIFEAKFKDGRLEGAVSFDEQGEIIETEEVIEREQLPNCQAIEDYVKANYSGETIQRCEKIVKRDSSTIYEIQINGKELLFDSEGKFSAIEPD